MDKETNHTEPAVQTCQTEEEYLNELNKEYQPNSLEQALIEEYEECDKLCRSWE